MKSYRIVFAFSNLDNSLYTDQAAEMDIVVRADDWAHVNMLALKLQRVYDADSYVLFEL